jgi:hypothetical protein
MTMVPLADSAGLPFSTIVPLTDSAPPLTTIVAPPRMTIVPLPLPPLSSPSPEDLIIIVPLLLSLSSPERGELSP